jgi:putative PIN family toxin of toxin-antitoxin system
VRLPFDTNVLVSTLISPRSTPAQAYRRAAEKHTLLMSDALWHELNTILERPKLRQFFLTEDVTFLLNDLDLRAEWVFAEPQFHACRDPKDNMLLDLATSGRADCIVTGDNDLLVLDPFEGIRILTPAAFLEIA